jgi:acyl-CoA thioesterase-2
MAPVPHPDDLAPSPVRLPAPLMDVRRLNPDESVQQSWHPYWARGTGSFGEDQMKHHAALSFISDYVVIFSVRDAPGVVAPTDSIRTISHALWFHRPVRADRWHFFAAEPRSVSERRGLTLGTISGEDGSLVASFAQEVIIRP